MAEWMPNALGGLLKRFGGCQDIGRIGMLSPSTVGRILQFLICAMLLLSTAANAETRTQADEALSRRLDQTMADGHACYDNVRLKNWVVVRTACAKIARRFEQNAGDAIHKAAYFKQIGNGVAEHDEQLQRAIELLYSAENWFSVAEADVFVGTHKEARRTLFHIRDLLHSCHRDLLKKQDELEPEVHRARRFDQLSSAVASVIVALR